MGKRAKSVYGQPKLMIKYKGVVPVTPLEMVDDILTILKCSSQSVQTNSVVNSFMDIKCHNVHIGKSKQCQKIRVHDETARQQGQQ